MTPADIGLRNFRRFAIQRDEDLTGNSGIGIVAVGVLLPNNWAVLHWLTAINSTTVFPSIANVETLHGHNGRTRIVWIDDDSALAARPSPPTATELERKWRETRAAREVAHD